MKCLLEQINLDVNPFCRLFSNLKQNTSIVATAIQVIAREEDILTQEVHHLPEKMAIVCDVAKR